MNTLSIAEQALADIVAHARQSAPLECCGVLLGTERHVLRTVRATNSLASPTRFVVDPADHFAAIEIARALGVGVVGAYHSHPASAADASPRDRDEADGQADGFLSLIVGLATADAPDVRAFEWRGGNFQPVQLVRIEQRD